jgi:hypothetical protein
MGLASSLAVDVDEGLPMRSRFLSPVVVADVSELLPGKGKVVEVRGHRVTIFNAAGRLRAFVGPLVGDAPGAGSGLPSSLAARVAPVAAVGCGAGGATRFEVFAEDSPAELDALGTEWSVEVRRRAVYVRPPALVRGVRPWRARTGRAPGRRARRA